jgi:membrane protein required for colicin V production
MMLDLLLAAVLIATVLLGVWRGALITGAGLMSLALAYVGSVLGTVYLGDWASEALVLPSLTGRMVGGLIGFTFAWLVSSSVADLCGAWDQARVESTGRGRLDRAVGGCFGLLRGGLLVVLLSLLASWLDASRDLGILAEEMAVPDASGSAFAQASGEIVEVAVSTVLPDAGPAVRVVARLGAKPGLALGGTQALLEGPQIAELLEDRLFWTLIMNDSVEYALNRQSARALMLDSETRGHFADLGLVDDAARRDPIVFERMMAGVLSEIVPRVRGLSRDPELLALAEDADFRRTIESGNVIALLADPRIARLASRLSQAPQEP